MRTVGFIATGFTVAGVLTCLVYGIWFILSFAETRRYCPPFWWGQYKTFFPGDIFLFLAIGVAAAIMRYNDLANPFWLPAWSGIVIGFVVAVVLFYVQFSPEEKAAPDAMWIWVAPTRVWHQLFVWWVGIALVVWLVVPVITALFNGSIRTTSAWLVLAFMLIYGGHMAYDALRPPVPEPGKPVHAPLAEKYRFPVLERLLGDIYPY